MSLRSAGGPLACVICIAAVQACSSSSEQAGGGSPDASTAPDTAGMPDAGYPPLKFADIGAAVPISTQFYFTEGPVWDPKKSVLYFTDINAHQGAAVGGAIYRLTLPNTFDVLLQPSGNADGIGLDPQGNIIAAGFLSRDVWRLSSTNTMQVLAPCSQDGGTVGGSDAETDGETEGAKDGETGATDGGVDAASDGATDAAMDGGGDAATDGATDGGTDGGTDDGATGGGADGAISGTADAGPSSGTSGGTCYEGQEINTPDDITSRSDGVLYFTDPTFASNTQGFPTLSLPLSAAQGVYRLTTDGVLHLEDSTTSGPNGVNLSPDEKTLYVSYTLTGEVAKFDVAADGSLSSKTTFATGATIADSMCVDAGGNVYVGTLTGLAVYNPAGQHLGTISVGGLVVTNCAFGGSDQKTLFITARTQATLSGAPPMGGGALYKIDGMPVPGIPGQN
jgi:sugar lactone lactonase YvrE